MAWIHLSQNTNPCYGHCNEILGSINSRLTEQLLGSHEGMWTLE